MANGNGSRNGNGQKRHHILTRETLVPIGIAGGVVMLIATGAVWWSAWTTRTDWTLARINEQMTDVRMQLEGSRQRFDARFENYYTLREMNAWLKLLQARNPEVDVPELR